MRMHRSKTELVPPEGSQAATPPSEPRELCKWMVINGVRVRRWDGPRQAFAHPDARSIWVGYFFVVAAGWKVVSAYHRRLDLSSDELLYGHLPMLLLLWSFPSLLHMAGVI